MALIYGNLKMPFRFHRLAATAEFKQAAKAHVRLARREEVPHVLALIQQQAEYHGLRDHCLATEAHLEAGLFAQQAFHGPTVLFLELPPSSFNFLPAHSVQDPSLVSAFLQKSEENPFPKPPSAEESEENPSPKPSSAEKSGAEPSPQPAFAEKTEEDSFAEKFNENPSPKTAFAEDPSTSLIEYLRNRNGIAHKIVVRAPIKDPQALAFRTAEGQIIAGFVLFFPNYISFSGKHGFYIEDLYVRECMRGHGFGTILFKSVARLAVELDYCAVEWRVLHWNEKAMKLYEGMGANTHPEWRVCSLAGESLKICGS